MRFEMNSRTYTNAVLSLIAACLVLLVVHFYRVSISSPAYAQAASLIGTPSSGRVFGRPGQSGPVDSQNIAQTMDTAVATATSDVAAANREIAAAIRELGTAVSNVGLAMGSKAPVSGGDIQVGPSAAAPAPAERLSATPAPVVQPMGATVEVGPSPGRR